MPSISRPNSSYSGLGPGGHHEFACVLEADAETVGLEVGTLVKPAQPEFVEAVVLFNVAVREAVLSVVVVCHR